MRYDYDVINSPVTPNEKIEVPDCKINNAIEQDKQMLELIDLCVIFDSYCFVSCETKDPNDFPTITCHDPLPHMR